MGLRSLGIRLLKSAICDIIDPVNEMDISIACLFQFSQLEISRASHLNYTPAFINCTYTFQRDLITFMTVPLALVIMSLNLLASAYQTKRYP